MKYVSERGAAWVPPEGERVAPALLRHLISHLACKSVFLALECLTTAAIRELSRCHRF